jgi:hypothetical protein
VSRASWVSMLIRQRTPLGPVDRDQGAEKRSPYKILASMADSGLGPCLWWDGDGAEDEEMGDDGADAHC